MNIILTLSMVIGVAWGEAVSAETIELVCEHWNNNLGQLPDKTYVIDFDGKTCRGEPCKISDTEFIWQMDSGSHEWRINRITGEGSHVVLLGNGRSQEIDHFKNCRVLAKNS